MRSLAHSRRPRPRPRSRLRRAGLGLAASLALACQGATPDSSPTPSRERPTVTTTRGALRGTVDGSAEVFRGIPYAAAPVGERRFAPPAPVPAWEGVREAVEFGPRCPQLASFGGGVIGDEDCLTLDVWRPAEPPELGADPRPVLVFFHGGGNVLGSTSDPLRNGRRLAREQDVIVVAVNYRLGVLGFLAHPRLTAAHGTSGNWAYLDMIAALDWVAENVAAFGGDPKRVTIAGDSAGGLGVCVLMASPLAAGKFSAAVVESGGCDVASLAVRERQGEGLVLRSGCGPAEDPFACFRALPAARMVKFGPQLPGTDPSWELLVGGAVDGHVLPHEPWDAFAAGTHAVVPTLVGSNADETALLIPRELPSCDAYASVARDLFGAQADAVLAEYPCAAYSSPRVAYLAATTDVLFTCQARRLLRALAPAADAAGVPLFRYYYRYTRADPAVSELLAFHGSELQLLFGTHTRLGYAVPEGERALARAMRASWAGMARAGTPVHAGTPGWEPWTAARDNAVVFADPLATGEGLGTDHCGFWDAQPRPSPVWAKAIDHPPRSSPEGQATPVPPSPQ